MPIADQQSIFAERTMTGVVLCGGQSTRMGTDKGLLQSGDGIWAAAATEKLTSLDLPVLVSVNKRQGSAYATFFKEEQLIADDDGLAVKGPLLGLLSVHARFPHHSLFVLACDMKDMTKTLMHGLINEATQNRHEAFVYTTEEKPQPLCGLYTAGGLRKVYERLQRGELERFSMMYVLSVLNTACLAVKKEEIRYFKNYNSPENF